MDAVRANSIFKTYQNGETSIHAVNGVDLAVRTGEFVSIMGPSGSGKSTLLSLLGGLEQPSMGGVWIGGESLAGKSEADLAVLRRSRVGFIFQGYNLVPLLTAEENVALPLLLAGEKGERVRTRVEEALAAVGLTDRRSHRPAELSGGQQQRVAIARALVTKPALVLADEPTGNLDSRSAVEVLTILRQCCDQFGQTILMVTHDPAMASWADRVIFLFDGRIVAEEHLNGPVVERTAAIRLQLERVSSYA